MIIPQVVVVPVSGEFTDRCCVHFLIPPANRQVVALLVDDSLPYDRCEVAAFHLFREEIDRVEGGGFVVVGQDGHRFEIGRGDYGVSLRFHLADAPAEIESEWWLNPLAWSKVVTAAHTEAWI
jgi:hypothetical protein